MDINNIPSNNVAANYQNYFGQQNQKPAEAAPTEQQSAAPTLQPRSAEDILNGLANAGNMNFIVSQIQTRPDFSVGLEERIAGFMGSFEEAITSFLSTMEEEFGNLPEFQNMSDEAKMAAAAEMFTQAYMPDAAQA